MYAAHSRALLSRRSVTCIGFLPDGRSRRACDKVGPMFRNKTWTVVFRCYNCHKKFTLRHITFDKIDQLHTVYPCPFCGTRPIVNARPRHVTNRSHDLIELSDEMETVYRKFRHGDTWHYHP